MTCVRVLPLFPADSETLQALTSWFYPGQPSAEFMLACTETVVEAVSSGGSEATSELAAEAGNELASHIQTLRSLVG